MSITVDEPDKAISTAKPGEPLIRIDKVSKYFYLDNSRLTALDEASLTIEQGSFVSIVGPSGCGKSTLLNLLAGIERFDSGSIVWEGKPVSGLRVGTGYMTQHDTLLPWLTVAQNVELPLRVGKDKTSRKQNLDQVDWAINLVGLRGFERHRPRQLSGGMRKRVALAQNLVYGRSVLLMDEPFGALDAQTRMVLQDELSRICAESQRTVVFVTHDIEEAIILSDRVVVMSARPGRIRDVVDIDLPRPRNVMTTRFDERFDTLYKYLWSELTTSESEADEDMKNSQDATEGQN